MNRHMLDHNSVVACRCMPVSIRSGAALLPSNSGDLSIICRDGAGSAGYGGACLKEPWGK
jgi:hypothetical protein